MPNFLENFFAQLEKNASRVVIREIHGENFLELTGGQLLQQIRRAQEWISRRNLSPGDRVAIVGPNSMRWIAIDIALMAEGLVVVPLYYRQAPGELAAVMRDCQPKLLIADGGVLRSSINAAWPAEAGFRFDTVLFDEILATSASPRVESQTDTARLSARADSDLVTIVYTSGTSGEPKGVCLNIGNVTFMLGRTTSRLDQLMRGSQRLDSIFHYLPLNFAASWIATLTFMLRESVVTLSTDLNKLADEIRLSQPHYFLNVPTLLERVRRGVDDAISKRPSIIRSLYERARDAAQREIDGTPKAFDGIWLALGRALIFSKIKERFGPNLRALICGSAPLAPETQNFFRMLGIRVLQVYGLTETTGICTMDDPDGTVDTGHVGPTIDGIEMQVGEENELIVRGPNIFPGYWNREEETAAVLRGGWFHTGDQGEKNEHGNWRIVGRVKNLLILNSGHKIPPEPIEDKLSQLLPAAQHVILVGNGRGYLCVILTGPLDKLAVQAALDNINRDLPHYRQIRNFSILNDTLTPDSGLLTAMGKLRRGVINDRFASQIEALYASKIT
ncbi:MAG TPA: AMP-binding protein [Verrucomicrobiae bacterium]|nr:AMP-binding protein [Verrucomicrobiae bacterium]